ncbi:MAG TPA: trypsin-like peptidase domain-containing protein [Patescibacteria group bacterium]|nr:trypsin-like peptidase domain-containing protein [Patescibacteria group bacterium]
MADKVIPTNPSPKPQTSTLTVGSHHHSNKTKTYSRRGLSGIVALVLVSSSFGFFGGWVQSQHSHNISTSAAAKQQIVSSESQLISGIAKDIGPSVVSVNVTGQSTQTDIFGQGQDVQQQSAGTGFIISSDGIVVTNRHVVPAGSTNISITLSDGTQLDNVSVIGRTSDSDSLDIAFLKINDKKGKNLQPVSLGDSGKVEVGDKVVAIGNALGQFQNTVTQGIISGHGRSVQAGDSSGGSSETLEDLFQTDAAINEGNSGGPLVNTSGEVIGINTAIAGNAQNIGFAIPINDVKGLINSVLQQGKLLRPYLGVRYVSLTPDVVSQLGLKVNNGAYVSAGPAGEPAIIAGSPADKANLQEKDIIIKVNNTAIDNNNSLTSVLGRYNVGDTVTLTVIRDGKTITLKATLAAAPSS